MAEVNPYVSEIFKLANAVAPAIVHNIANTKQTPPAALEGALQRTLYDNSLNGSGPSDPGLSNATAPRTMLDQITGRMDSSNPSVPSGGMPNMLWIAIAVLVGVLILNK